MSFSETIQALSVIASFILIIVVVVIQSRTHGGLVTALTEVVKAQSSNKPALDLVEPVLSKAITPSTLTAINKLADLLEALAPADVDALIEASRVLVNKASDGQPNAAPPASG